VVSDFISEPGWEKPLGQLAQRHEVIAVRVLDPLELELPDLGLLPLRDAETGEQVWSTPTTRLSQALRPHRRRSAKPTARGAGPGRRRCAGTLHRRRPGRRHRPLRRHAQAPHADIGSLPAHLRTLPDPEQAMQFLWPQFLWLLLALPLLVGLYVAAARARRSWRCATRRCPS
jgi:hypothetical protein